MNTEALATESIAQMIERLCPDGVEWVPLGEIGQFIKGSGLQKSQLQENGHPAIHYGQLHTEYHRQAQETISFVNETVYSKLKKAQYNDVLLATTSEDAAAVGKAVAWLGDEVAISGDAHIFRSDQNATYLAYALVAHEFQWRKRKYITGAKVMRLSSQSLAKIPIPLPPLEVQREIVKELDQFAALEKVLQAEIEGREKQAQQLRNSYIARCFRHYQTVLLDDAVNAGSIELGRGKVISKKAIAQDPGSYPVYSSSSVGNGEIGRYGSFMFEDERITWSVDGGGRLFYRPKHRYSVTNVSGWLKVHASDIDTRFVFHTLYSQWEKETFDYTRKAHPSVIRNIYKIVLPPIDIQREIADDLDVFTDYINNLKRERELRQQQYEGLREQLLTFPKKESA